MFNINEELLTEKEWARNIDNFTVKQKAREKVLNR